MKNVLIVLNGRKNPAEFVSKLAGNADFVIGTDGGAEFLFENNIPFDVAIGDFDSLSNKNLIEEFRKNKIEVIKFPREKDFSDTELAVRFALKKGYFDFTFTNALGNRIDHLLFNISVMIFLTEQKKKCKILDKEEEIYITENNLKLEVKKEYTVSVYPLTQTVIIENSYGLKYPLKGLRITQNSTLTLSNIIIKNEVYIKVKSGMILFIIEKHV